MKNKLALNQKVIIELDGHHRMFGSIVNLNSHIHVSVSPGVVMTVTKDIVTPWKKLSKHELQYLQLLSEGFKNRDIALQIFTKNGEPSNEKTIGTYKSRCKQKLHLDINVNEYIIVRTAIELNLV